MGKFQFSAAAAAAVLAVAGTAEAAQVVVIDARGSILKTIAIGSVIDDSTLDIPEHDQLTIMTASGDTIQVNGPHKGPVSATGGGDPGMLQKLSEVLQEKQGAFGTTREIEFQATPGERKSDPWAIDADFSGTACVFAGRPAQLFLPKSAGATSVTIKDEKSGASAAISWPSDSVEAPWPAALPAVDGDSYTVSFGTSHRTITLKKVAAASSEGQGALLAAGAGCNGQARDLTKAVKPVKAS